MAGKLIPGYETILAVPAAEVNGVPWMVTPTGLVDYSAPTAAALNVYQAIVTGTPTAGGAGGNISCAVLDDLNLGLTSSDTSNVKTVCSKGNSEDPTFYNFDAELNILRDEDQVAAGLFNLARDLFRAADAPYFIVHRVKGGKDSSETFAIGDEVDIYYVWTDHPVPGFGDGDELTVNVTLIPKGIVNVGYTLVA